VFLDRAILQQREFIMRETRAVGESMRLETMSVHREQLIAVQKRAEEKLESVVGAIRANASAVEEMKQAIQVSYIVMCNIFTSYLKYFFVSFVHRISQKRHALQ